MLQPCHAGTGFMHESFRQGDCHKIFEEMVCLGEHHFLASLYDKSILKKSRTYLLSNLH